MRENHVFAQEIGSQFLRNSWGRRRLSGAEQGISNRTETVQNLRHETAKA